jgi:hypothetical protein
MLLRMRAPRELLLVWVLLTGPWALGPSPAWGQTVEQRAAARATAQAGGEAFDEGRYQDAIDLFTRAEAVVHAPPHLLHIARASAKLGRLVSAQDAYLKIVRERLAPNAPEVFREAWAAAERELAELEPRIPQLTIQVEGGGVENVRVTMDGHPIPNALLGIPHPVDPGEHEISAEPTVGQRLVRSLALADGARETVVFTLAPAAPSAEPPPPPPLPQPTVTTPPEQPSRGFFVHPAVAYGALGVGAVGLVVGTAYLVSYLRTRDDADSAVRACWPYCTAAQRSRVDELDTRTAQRGTLSVIGFVAGGVGVAGGAILLIAGSWNKLEGARGMAVYPYLGDRAVGLWGRY